MAADDLQGSLVNRRHQMFPELTDAEIARIRRFGQVRHYKRGERLFAAGEPGPGMFVVLDGKVVISQRDGLGHVVPIASQGPGQFIGEVAALSGGTPWWTGTPKRTPKCFWYPLNSCARSSSPRQTWVSASSAP